MSFKEEGYLILGIAVNGHKFRPSDWVDRLATAYGSFDASRRIRYHPMVKPTHTEGERCLFVAEGLAEQDPDAYNFIMDFANSHRLQVNSTYQIDTLCSAA